MSQDTHRATGGEEDRLPTRIDRGFVWEPRLEDLLCDPVTRHRAAADGLGIADLRRLIDGYRRVGG